MKANYVGQFVGVIPPSAFETLGYPKQLLLMFDSLAIDIGQKGLSPVDRQIIQNSMGEISYLAQSELLTLLSGLLAHNEIAPTMKSLTSARKTLGTNQVTHERFNAYLLRKKGIDAVPIMHQFEDLDIDKKVTRDMAVRLTIREFPVPSDETPWEAIQDFRSDESARKHFWNLKDWMNKAGASELTHYEITDQLRSLLNDYNGSMKLHKMKYQTGIFEAVVTTTATFAENLVKIKWADAAKSIFEAQKQDVQLLDDECNMPGKEVAYIAKARNRFR